MIYTDPLGLATQASGISGTIQAGIPQLGFLGAGFGGGTSIGISIPDNLFNWECYQIFVQIQANAYGGVGAFAGVGFAGGVTTSDGPISNSSSSGIITEGNIGLGVAVGGNATASGNVTNPSDWMNPINGGSGTIAARFGAGFGISAAVGQYTSSVLATPVGGSCECN